MPLAELSRMPVRTLNTVFGLSDRAGDLALACDDSGLHLAGVPLLRCEGGSYHPRPTVEITALLSAAYGSPVDGEFYRDGLTAVAGAINEGATARAMIAAIFLKLPPLDWDGAVRIARADEDLWKYDPDEPRDARGRWTTGSGAGSDDSAAEAEKPVTLPDGRRNDELGDFLEWIVNARPEDEADIRGEIKRYYYDVGDVFGGDAMNAALSAALEPGVTRADRQSILDEYEPYTHGDPATVGAALNLFVTGALMGIPLAGEAIAETAEAAASPVWQLGWAERGRRISIAFGQNLRENYPVIDKFENGIATSIKSIDLNAKTYLDAVRLTRRTEKYLGQLESFNTDGKIIIDNFSHEITAKKLKIIIPKNSIKPHQKSVFDDLNRRLHNRNIEISVEDY